MKMFFVALLSLAWPASALASDANGLATATSPGAVQVDGTTIVAAPQFSAKTGLWTTVISTGTGLLPILNGTTGSIGGSVLLAGACTSGTVAVTGSTTGMAVQATPVTYPGDGATWAGYVSAGGTVTVKVCAIVGLTPTASTYNVRVIQ